MSMITASQLRSSYLASYARHGCAAIPAAPLVPANDPSVLFTTAAMHPLAPHLLGEPHPAGRRPVNVQECVRTGDIDAVGDDRHLTWFEMLGSWSLGDFGRDEAIVDRATGEVVSREFCAGPHVASTAEPRGRRFQIVREHGLAAGVRRIKAVLAGRGLANLDDSRR